MRSSTGLLSASRKVSATGVPVCTPHTGRLSTSTEARISAFSWVGSCDPAARRVLPGVQRAHERRVGRDRPVRVGAHPAHLQVGRSPWRRATCRRGRTAASSASPNQTIACRRRSWAPSRAAPGCRAPARRTTRAARRRAANSELEHPAGERVDDDRVDRHDVRGGDARVVHRDHHRESSRAALASSSTVCARADPLAQEERRPRVRRDEVDVLDHAEDPPGRRHDREMAKPAVEHLEQDVAAEPVRRAGVRGCGHRRRDRRVAAKARRQDAGSQVAIGEDPERAVAEVDDRARRARGASSLRTTSRIGVCGSQTTGEPRGSALPTGW